MGADPAEIIIENIQFTGGGVDENYGLGYGPNGAVLASVTQFGLSIIGGEFTTYNGTTVNRIARLRTDGDLDTTFAVGSGAVGGDVLGLAIDANQNPLLTTNVNKIVVIGTFGSFAGNGGYDGIVRLLTNGAIDSSFSASVNPNGAIRAVVVQADGKLIIGGSFTQIGGVTRSKLARLNADGTLDTGFPDAGASDDIYSLVVQADGKIVVGGDFNSLGGTAANRIARLNTDGTVDASFDPGAGANGRVRAIVETGGHLYVGGEFTPPSFGPAVTNKIITGGTATLQTRTAHGLGVGNVVVVSISDVGFDGTVTLTAVDAGNRTLSYTVAGGDVASTPVTPNGFVSQANKPVNRIAKLDSTTGAVVTSFNDNLGSGPSGAVHTIAVQGLSWWLAVHSQDRGSGR